MNEQYDLIVIGSGGGLKLAIPAAQMGKKVAVIEKGPLGGTCLNRGCIPSKMLIYPADFIEEVRRCARFNISMSPDEVSIDYKALVTRIRASTGEISASIVKRLEGMSNLTLIRETAVFTREKTLQAGNRTLSSDTIIIAAGSVPKTLAVDGLSSVPYITSTEALCLPELPKRMIVIGAGYIACELGHAYSMFGTETHFLVRSRLLRKEDDDVQKLFEKAFSRHNHIHEGVVPVHVEYHDGEFFVTIENMDGKQSILQADQLLLAAGVTPATEELRLAQTGLACDENGFIPVNECLETNVPGIYALGDVIGRYLFRHSVNLEGEYLFDQLYGDGDKKPIDYGPMPHAVFTVPEIAGAGYTEQEARGRQVDYICGIAYYSDSNMGMARQTDEGFAKLLIDKADRRIIGIQIIGPDAATLVQSVVNLMYADGTLDDLLKAVYIHPAQPELIRDAARDARDKLH